MRLHDYPASGNCYKVRLLLAQLGVDYERVHVDIFDGGTLTDEFAALNPTRTVPVLETDAGMPLLESNAILVYLAEGTELLPDDPVERAQVLRWLFYEQAEIVPSIGGLRVRLAAAVLAPDSGGAQRGRAAGAAALSVLEDHLRERRFLVGERYSVADIAIYGYVHVAGDAGLDLAEYPSVQGWIERVEATPGHVDDLDPIPATTRFGAGRSKYG
ncbi:MAG: glutathione S-transferase [Thermoleophilaceae bacterium]|jgi:glutathione S-transferase|nr:glutathione S-transferase [Thermoleophilaceae bacterium]